VTCIAFGAAAPGPAHARDVGRLGQSVVEAGVGRVSIAAAHGRCSGRFEGHVRSGPSADLSLVGELTIDLSDAGRISGSLVQRDGARLVHVARVVGAVEGRRLRLRFETRSGKRVAGVGTAAHDIARCADFPSTGALRGPHRRDRGDWGWALGG
jgi:hypothetical protein